MNISHGQAPASTRLDKASLLYRPDALPAKMHVSVKTLECRENPARFFIGATHAKQDAGRPLQLSHDLAREAESF